MVSPDDFERRRRRAPTGTPGAARTAVTAPEAAHHRARVMVAESPEVELVALELGDVERALVILAVLAGHVESGQEEIRGGAPVDHDVAHVGVGALAHGDGLERLLLVLDEKPL